MLAKCANPICGAHFRYLSQGRVFNVPLYEEICKNGTFEDATKPKSRPRLQRVELYWLCANCLLTMKLILRRGKVEVLPRFAQLTDGDAGKPAPLKSASTAA
jgi:hypothetical protein